MGANGAGLAPTQELYLELLEEYYPMPGANGTGLAPQQELSVELEELAQLQSQAIMGPNGASNISLGDMGLSGSSFWDDDLELTGVAYPSSETGLCVSGEINLDCDLIVTQYAQTEGFA